MLRPLFHKQRKDLVQKKLLQKMDYANVIRRSYSRSKGSRTTDQLVIEETAQCAFDLHNIRKSQIKQANQENINLTNQNTLSNSHKSRSVSLSPASLANRKIASSQTRGGYSNISANRRLTSRASVSRSPPKHNPDSPTFRGNQPINPYYHQLSPTISHPTE